jgi:hypothetical protein
MNSNDLVDRQEVAINSLEFERQVRELRRVTHLRRILQTYACYYNKIRTHRSLDKDAPVSRLVQPTGSIKSYPILGGLHHHYVRV